MLKSYIGTKQFYKIAIAITLPILLQNVITNLVNMIDNMMVGRIGTSPMTGVAIINQLFFVYALGIFGLLSGIGIFTAQFFGKGDMGGVRKTFAFKCICILFYIAAGFLIFHFLGDKMIWSYLHEGKAGLNLEESFTYAHVYLNTILWGLVPFAIGQVYASTLREMREATVPMVAGIVAVFTNLILNYILIYGKFGAPTLGVVGAGIATNVSRFVECSIDIAWVVKNKKKVPLHLDRESFQLSPDFIKTLMITGLPLFMNEFLWSSGQTILNQIMSKRGIEVVSALNISSTTLNLSNTFYLAAGTAISIIIGNALGRNDIKGAIETQRQLTFATAVISTLIGIVTFVAAPFIANIYNTEPEVKMLAIQFIRISSFLLPFEALVVSFYYTLRSGGKTVITFVFDSCFSWGVSIPVALLLLQFRSLPITGMYAIIYGLVGIKFILGIYLVRKGTWAHVLV